MGRCCCILNTLANIFKWLPVVIILGALSWGYYAYVYELCIRNIESNVQRVLYLIIFHVLLGLFIVSYYKTIFTPIGKPPSSFFLPSEMAEEMDVSKMDGTQYNNILRRFVEQNRLQLMTRAFDGGFRYCDICKCVKPDRAHHCSMCGQCVLKFDHHCPWVNTCVNFHNYKFFLLFLGYGFLFCLFVAFTDLPYFIRFWGAFGENRFVLPPGGYHIVLLVFVAGMFAISLSCLFFYHLYLTARNRSTIESFRAPLLEGGPDKNAFNHGIRANYREIFGRDRRLWFLPVFSSCGCGSVYRVRGVDAAYQRQNHVEHAQVRNELTYNPNATYPSSSSPKTQSTSPSLSASVMA